MAYIKEPKEYFKLLDSDECRVKSVNLVDEDTVRVTFEENEMFISNLPNVNVAIAAFTTAYARLELYRILEKCQERCKCPMLNE